MSKEPRYRWIGIFVIGAIVLATVCLVFFGRFKLFEQSYTFISYFRGSVKGLQPGAPVRFRGAKVGAVKDISIVYRQDTDELSIPVLLQLDAATVKGIVPDPETKTSVPLIERLVQRGLRAQLGLDSIVTGQLYVQLDFMPDVPIELQESPDEDYPEIPTARSPLDKIQSTLESLPLGEIVNRFVHILESVDTFIASPQLKESLVDMASLITDLRQLAVDIDKRSEVLITELDTLSSSTNDTLKSIGRTVEDARPAIRQSRETLDELAKMSRAVRRLADLLEQQPEAIIIGKD